MPNLGVVTSNHGEVQPTQIAKEYIEQKINKGTIEEQIEACTTIPKPNGLKSFEVFAKSNPKIKSLYDKKLKELTV
jgi:hypothetical protein